MEDRFPPGAVEPYGEPAAEAAAILEQLAADLAELEPPGDRDLIAGQLVSFLETEAGGLRDVEEAAASGAELDPRVETDISVTHSQRLGIATSVGLEECAVRVFTP
jgi:hypothetical protein